LAAGTPWGGALMEPNASDLLVWIGCASFIIVGLNQGFSLWQNLTAKMMQRADPENERLITAPELDRRLTALSLKVEKVDKRLRNMVGPLAKLIGVIAAREKIDIQLPTEEDAS